MLSKEDFEFLIKKGYEEFISRLSTYPIGEALKKEKVGQAQEIERILTAGLLHELDFILSHSPPKERNFFQAYAYKFEILNIQRLIRYHYANVKADYSKVINLRAQEILGRTAFISRLIQTKDLADLIGILKSSEYEKYITYAEELYKTFGDIWPFELILENYYQSKMKEKAKDLPKAEKERAMLYVNLETLRYLIQLTLRADFVKADISAIVKEIKIDTDFPYHRYLKQMLSTDDLDEDLEILEQFGSTVIQRGIHKYRQDKFFLHLEIAIHARELQLITKHFKEDFGILAILAYLKKYELQIKDITRLLYLKEYNFPPEKIKELIIHLVVE